MVTNANTQFLKEIHIVLPRDDMLLAIGAAFLEKKIKKPWKDQSSVVELDQYDVYLAIDRRLKQNTSEFFILNEVNVFISSIDIMKLKADAIVCLNDERLSSSTGLANELSSRAGTKYRDKCEELARRKQFQPSEVVCIETEKFGLVINAIVPDLVTGSDTDKEDGDGTCKEMLLKIYQNIMNEVRCRDIYSVVMSPIKPGRSILYKRVTLYYRTIK